MANFAAERAEEADRAGIDKKFTVRKVTLDLSPSQYDPELVKTTREILGTSQAVFARFIGVSVRTVRAWEQGINVPMDIACRLMDEIRHDPKYWRARLRKLATAKSANLHTHP